jgi:hypothetical protein
MSYRRHALICLASLCLAPGLGAATVDEVAPPIAPQPVTTPLPPTLAPGEHANPDDALLQRLDRQIQSRDRTMAEMMKGGISPNPVAGRTPHADRPDAPTMEALKAHAEARRDLRAALDQAAKRGQGASKDILDRGTPRAQAGQTGPLTALNQLAIAECWKDLAGAPDGTAADVESGLAALAATDASRLSDGDRPRLLYLGLWFQLEGVRKLPKDAPATERSKRLAAARDRQSDLVNQFPASPLAQTAEALFAGLAAP